MPYEMRAAYKAGKSEDARAVAYIWREEHRAMKDDVWVWCDTNFCIERATEAVYKSQLVFAAFRAIRDWISQWSRQLRSARIP